MYGTFFCQDCSNQYLSPETFFCQDCSNQLIQGSKVCSTIRPLTLPHCFAPCGKQQPVPFTKTFICQDCSNQFRDPRVQSVLDYPPPPSASCFGWFQGNHVWKAPTSTFPFARIAPTSFEIQGSKVSTIRPLPLCHCFGWFQGNHVWKAPTSTFHQNLFLPGLLQPVSRSKGPKCARLSAPSLCATVLVGFKETMYGKPQPVAFTRTFFCQDCSNQFRIQGSKVCAVMTIRPLPLCHCFGFHQNLLLPGLLQPVSRSNHVWKAPTSSFHQNLFLPGLLQPVSRSKGPECPRLSAPSLCPTVLVGFKETLYEKPQPVPFTKTFICQDCSNQFRDPRVQSVLDYPPPPSVSLFWLVSRKPCMESPNQYLSPEPSFARIAPTSFEIQGSKVCSTIRPLTLPHCFGWFQGNHVWKAPTSTFHQNLLLPGLLQPVSRSKGPKRA